MEVVWETDVGGSYPDTLAVAVAEAVAVAVAVAVVP